MIDPVVTAAALASTEANLKVIEERAASLAGKPTELDAQILLEHARICANNLRELLASTERRTA